MRLLLSGVFVAGLLAVGTYGVEAGGTYDQGASDTEIRIGQTMAYSGLASAASSSGKVQLAYFARLNKNGGINGRKITLISLDDGYSPPKTVEQTRRLVEREGVLAVAGSLGGQTNMAVRDYLKSKGVPQIFIQGGTWDDPVNYPTTIGATHSYVTVGQLFGAYILKTKPNAKIAVLYQNDELGKGTLKAFKEALGPKASQITVEAAYDTVAPSIDSEITTLAASGADAFLDISIGKFAAQAVRRAAELGWKPLHMVDNGAAQIFQKLPDNERPNAIGVISVGFYKNPADPAYASDPGMVDYHSLIKEYAPEVHPSDPIGVNGYLVAQLIEYALRKSGDNLTRENLLKQVKNINNLELSLLLPGVSVNIQPDNFKVFRAGHVQTFDGNNWIVEKELISFK